MVDSTAAGQLSGGGVLMSIGEVAARNIAHGLNLGDQHVPTIEQAIKDEINAMSSHFTLAIADVETTHEVERNKLKAEYDRAVTEIKSAYNFVQANLGKLIAMGASLFLLGVLTGYLVG